jgi:type IV pilus assembly protein PilY1
MKIRWIAKRVVLCGSLALVPFGSDAEPHALAQAPHNAAFKEPPPNVIVSVDNSESMEWSSEISEGSEASENGALSRLEALRSAVKANFSALRVPEGSIRLAWQAMNRSTKTDDEKNCVGFSGDTSFGDYRASACTFGGTPHANLMHPLDTKHRKNFFDWIDALVPRGGTGSHGMMTRAGEYMKAEGALSPYSDDPGKPTATRSTCRRSFHIFMTDGEYTMFGFNPSPAGLGMPAVGNADGTPRVLPDGVNYMPRAPYEDGVGALNNPADWIDLGGGRWKPPAAYRPTLADLAFHYWATDLQPNMANDLVVPASIVGEGGAATPDAYWDPKNNPARWQHLTTHAIGFGSAASWTRSPTFSPDSAQPTYSGDYAKLVDGSLEWPDPFGGLSWNRWADFGYGFGYEYKVDEAEAPVVRMDLWHAALNSRGTFTPATNSTALSNAFDAILRGILRNRTAPLTSIAANASKLSTGKAVYLAGYDTADWSGRLSSRLIDEAGKPNEIPHWSAHELLDARMAKDGAADTDREVLSFSRTPVASGVPFRWASLSESQKAALSPGTGTAAERQARGEAVLAFLRGDRSNEAPTGLKLRARTHVLGDIVGSSVWYAGQPASGFTHDAYAAFAKAERTPMLYVGANDGMLHAFDAGTGQEMFAYVPEGLFGTPAAPLLKRLSESTYGHRYYVNGSPFVADIAMTEPATAATAAQWRSYLVGTLGAGGRGYFVLDVTKPADVTEANVATKVVFDTTALADDDLGHQFQQPVRDSFSGRALQIAPLNNGRKALILGNGYNSVSEKAALWIQYLDGDKSVQKIFAPPAQADGTGNGLSAPLPVDRNNDGTVDFVYAGDLLGNLWRFDLSGSDSTKWKATLGSAASTSELDDKPLFVAGDQQPITAAPLVADHPFGGYMVMVGTGRLFSVGDENIAATQYVYGVWDRADGGAGTAALADLVAQTVDEATVMHDGVRYRTASSNDVRYGEADGKRGWYLALPMSKERVLYSGIALNSNVGLFSSTIPGRASDTNMCAVGTSNDGWTMGIDFFSGVAPEGIVYNDLSAADSYLGFDNNSGGDPLVVYGEGGKRQIRNSDDGSGSGSGSGSDPDPGPNEVLPPTHVGRFGWRNLISSN